jgi:hypothetical protein
LASAVSYQRFTQEVEDRALLLAAGFDHGEDPFDKPAARI